MIAGSRKLPGSQVGKERSPLRWTTRAKPNLQAFSSTKTRLGAANGARNLPTSTARSLWISCSKQVRDPGLSSIVAPPDGLSGLHPSVDPTELGLSLLTESDAVHPPWACFPLGGIPWRQVRMSAAMRAVSSRRVQYTMMEPREPKRSPRSSEIRA